MKNFKVTPTLSNVEKEGKKYPEDRDVIDAWCYSTIPECSEAYGIDMGYKIPEMNKRILEQAAARKRYEWTQIAMITGAFLAQALI